MILNPGQKNARRAVMIAAITMIVLHRLFYSFIRPEQIPTLHIRIAELLVAGQVWALCFYGKAKTHMDRLLLCYVLWAVFTRIMLRDFSEEISLEMLCLVEMCIAFYAGAHLDSRDAENVLKTVTGVFCGVLTLWVVFGLPVVLTNTERTDFFDMYITIYQEQEGALRFLNFSAAHRNESSCWFMIGIWLLVYQWLTCKKKLWRIPMALSMALFYLGIALQHSRSIYVITALGVAALAALALQNRNMKKLWKTVLTVLAVVVCALVVYKSFSWSNDGVNRLSSRMKTAQSAAQLPEPEPEQPSMEETAPQLPDPAPQPEPLSENTEAPLPEQNVPQQTEAPVDDAMADGRSFLKDLLTLTMRTEIWHTEAFVLKHYPTFLIFGQKMDSIPTNLIHYGGLGREVSHLHDGLLQIVAMYGLLGLVLFAAFLVLLFWKNLKILFSDVPLPKKVLVILVLGLFVYSFMEPMFSAHLGLTSALFMLLAGMISRESEQPIQPEEHV